MFAQVLPLGPAGFGSAGMLLWAVAAAIPVLLHVWRRRHARRLDWAAMDFLTRAVQQNARRLRVQHLLLLAIRVLILLLLALALADPYIWIDSTHAAANARRPRHYVLVLDASYSMGLLHQGVSRFDVARQQALDVVHRSATGDAFSLIRMGLPNRSIFGRPAFDQDAVAEEIRQLTCGDGGADLEQTLQLVDQLVEQAKEADPPLEVCEVFWFTDLRSNTWQPFKTERVAQRVRELATQATLIMVDLGVPPEVNLAVRDLRTSANYVTVGREVIFHVTVDNLGREPVVDAPIELLVEGRAVARRTLQSAPGGTQTVDFAHRFTAAGDHRVQIQLPQDSLPADNQRFLVVPVRTAIRALCVGGQDRSARYVAMALQPDPTQVKSVSATRIAAPVLRQTDLVPYDAVFVCNVQGLGRTEADLLREHLARGGGLVFLLGEQTQSALYNRLLVDVSEDRRVMPARLIGPVPRGEYRFDPRDYAHPIVQPFQGHESTGLLTTPLWRYVQVEPCSAADVALRFDRGDPAIVEEPRDRGRCLLVATPASDAGPDAVSADAAAWNAWAIWPSFPPLIFELLERAVNRRFEGRNVRIGNEISGFPPSLPTGDEVTVQRETDQVVWRLPGARTDQAWSFTETWSSGFYAVRFGSQPEGRQLFAANSDTLESHPESLSPADLGEAFDVRTAEDLAQPTDVGQATADRPLFRWLLGLLLVMVLGESMLSWCQGGGQLPDGDGVERNESSWATRLS